MPEMRWAWAGMSGMSTVQTPESKDPVKLRKAELEGAAKGSLGAVRSALAIYYGDLEGRYPESLDMLTVNMKYLREVPALEIGGHKRTTMVTRLRNVRSQAELEAQLKDTGGWGYVSDPDSPLFGTLIIDCRHNDERGMPWFKY